MATIRIPPILRPEADSQRQVEARGATVREVLESLVARYPSLRERILAGDELPQFLNVFIDGSDVRLLGGLDTPVAETATVILLPAVAGGSPGPDAEAESLAGRDHLRAVPVRGGAAEARRPPSAERVRRSAGRAGMAVADAPRVRA